MTSVSIEKWPVELNIVKVADSAVPELELFLVSGVVNANQLDTLKARMPVLSECQFEKDRYMFSTLVNKNQIDNTYQEFKRLAKEWRGQYYALTNKYVEVCRSWLEG